MLALAQVTSARICSQEKIVIGKEDELHRRNNVLINSDLGTNLYCNCSEHARASLWKIHLESLTLSICQRLA
jgi:hypothetical protein